ncbi:MAG: glycosyltransferase family 39 protein [Bryobacteraceae bacterium]
MHQLIFRLNRWLAGQGEACPDHFRGWENALERFAEKYRLLLVGAVSILYLAATVQLAKAKLIWTDEFFTLYLGRLGPRELWNALLTGGDQHPPPFYLIHNLFLRIFGEHPWSLRLPPILGFLLMMLCIYQFVARRTSTTYGLVAMVMPLATVAHEYAYEARGYGLVLGFIALAVLCWQQTGESNLRTAAVLGLAAALIGAVSSHYYAVLLLPAIALAETVRSLRCKSWNPRVWLAVCSPVVLLLAFLPVIRSSSRFGATFWAKAQFHEINLFYRSILGWGITGWGVGLAAAGLYLMFRNHGRKPRFAVSGSMPVEEIVLAVALAAAPVTAYLFARVFTGAFAWRYAIGGVVGIAILFGIFNFKVFRGNVAAGSLIVIAIIGFFLGNAQVRMQDLVSEQRGLRNVIGLLETEGDRSEPLIIGDSKTFYALCYYGPSTMKERLLYLVDAQRSLQYLRHDTNERSLWALYPWFGVKVKAYKPYIETHRKMIIWAGVDPKWSWLPSALIDDGEKLTVLGRRGIGMLFLVRGGEAGLEH